MDIRCSGLRDRRVAASEETISVAGDRIFGRGSVARARGAEGIRRTDRSPSSIRAIMLHQTAGRTFMPSQRGAYPEDDSSDSTVRSDHALDRVSAHFVVVGDGTIFYTHDVELIINSAGGRVGIDIEFAGRYSSARRLSREAILSGRELVRSLKRLIPTITNIHPHGQVQRFDSGGRCGGTTGNRPDKLDTCPGPDIWVNVGQWAVASLGLICDPPPAGYQNNGISPVQSDATFDQGV